jgi:hypothetical protein
VSRIQCPSQALVAPAYNPSYSDGRDQETQGSEIRRIEVQSQPRQIVHETLSRKKSITKKKTGGVAQGVGPEFKPQ